MNLPYKLMKGEPKNKKSSFGKDDVKGLTVPPIGPVLPNNNKFQVQILKAQPTQGATHRIKTSETRDNEDLINLKAIVKTLQSKIRVLEERIKLLERKNI